jgi:hypothetical protein
MNYADRYHEAIGNGRYETARIRISVLAQIHYTDSGNLEPKDNCISLALEDYEDMTGNYADLSPREFQDIMDSIF